MNHKTDKYHGTEVDLSSLPPPTRRGEDPSGAFSLIWVRGAEGLRLRLGGRAGPVLHEFGPGGVPTREVSGSLDLCLVMARTWLERHSTSEPR